MARGTADTPGEGNNADWYLELVGVMPSGSGPPTTFDDLAPVAGATPPPPPATAPPSEDDTVEAPAGDDAPGPAIQTLDTVPTTESTTELVGQLWDATGRQDPLENWAPEELSRTIQSKRNYRWTVVAVSIVVLVVGWVLLAWLPSLPETRADRRAADYRAALGDLRGTLPAAQAALAAITDPSGSDEGDLGAIISAVTDLETAAERTTRLAAEPLPSGIPLLSRSPIEALDPTRDRLGMIGADAEALGGRLSDTLSYRSLYASILDLPDLPAEAGTEQINELSVALAAVLADSVGLRAEIPSTDPVFAEHIAATDAAIERYTTWQVDYIDALRQGEAESAATLVEEMQAVRTDLDVGLMEALAAFRTAADTELLRLADEIDRALTGLPG